MPEFDEAVSKLTRSGLQFPRLEITVSPLSPTQTDSDASIQLSAVGVRYDWESTDNGVTWTHKTGPVEKRVNVSPDLIAAVPAAQRSAIYAALKGLVYAQHAADLAAEQAAQQLPPPQ